MNRTEHPNLNKTPFYHFENFFELSPDLLCIAGFDGYFKRINPAVSKLLGYSNEELYTRPISDFIFEADRQLTARHRDELLNNKPLLNFENRYVCKNGEIVWLSWTSMPDVNEQLVYAIAKNITYKKKLEDERNSHLAQLTQLHRDLKQLTYTTSHDLRSPVNNLIAVLNVIDPSRIDDEETLELIGLLKDTGDHLKKTLNNSVDVLIQKNKLDIPVEEVTFSECLNTVLTSIHSLVHHARASIHRDFSALEKINFNKAYLESIFLNLITNSIKYAQPDKTPVISIYSRRQNGANQLIFSDNGIGFDMANLKDKIFGFHQTFHPSNDSKGIGLYLVYNHITGLGGQINLESKPGEGATFTITFKD